MALLQVTTDPTSRNLGLTAARSVVGQVQKGLGRLVAESTRRTRLQVLRRLVATDPSYIAHEQDPGEFTPSHAELCLGSG